MARAAACACVASVQMTVVDNLYGSARKLRFKPRPDFKRIGSHDWLSCANRLM